MTKSKYRGGMFVASRLARCIAFLLGAILFSACSSDPADDSSQESSQDDVAVDDVSLDQEADQPEWSGNPLNPFDLRSGDCFNEVSWIDQEAERRISITAEIDCTQPHDKEVYHEAEFPAPAGAPFPGEGPMDAWSTELCYEAFESFVGEEYEISVYGIDFLQPTVETFEHPVGRHRRVTCFLYSTSGDPLVGTARGTSI